MSCLTKVQDTIAVHHVDSKGPYLDELKTLPKRDEFGHAVSQLVLSVALYADRYYREFNSTLGDDGIMGDAVGDILAGVKTLLNGPTGSLDCASMERAINVIRRHHGIKGE